MTSHNRVAFLAADGVEQIEHDVPWRALTAASFRPELVSMSSGQITAFTFPEPTGTYQVHRTFDHVSADEYVAVVIPGGTASPDLLRNDAEAVAFVRSASALNLPIAAICHAPWLLIEAGLAPGRRFTSWPSLATDIRNAGGDWEDQPVVIDHNIITSRGPEDLEAFCRAITTALLDRRWRRAQG
ncbi:type 1 glutamine amidotransferase domain-containing protein [Ornithinimicrobium murale]|uniref:type 1 glutamine amidotransferase domain-containing protein n=1 Tax=Ornithinimicrobium murale TaxID=1050153 RepID=UPI000E0DB6D9|nr:type 1 glutamine amidotransferase domain-containing protein [Ornithinimicrobium murale]